MNEKVAVEADVDHIDPVPSGDRADMAPSGGSVDGGYSDGTDPLQRIPSYSRAGEELDPRYWRSPRFLGCLVGMILLANALFIGQAMPINILSVIDADIGALPPPLSSSPMPVLTTSPVCIC